MICILCFLIIFVCKINSFDKINLNRYVLKKNLRDESHKFLDPECGEGLSGFDCRYSLNITKESEEELFKIKKYLELNKILNSLESSKISEIEKLNIIDYNYILDQDTIVNLTSGGLMDDWNFNIIL